MSAAAISLRLLDNSSGPLRSRPGSDQRNFGYSAAHETDPLPLLPSGPGGVCGESLHRARSSTLRPSESRQLQTKILAHARVSANLQSEGEVRAVNGMRVGW